MSIELEGKLGYCSLVVFRLQSMAQDIVGFQLRDREKTGNVGLGRLEGKACRRPSAF